MTRPSNAPEVCHNHPANKKQFGPPFVWQVQKRPSPVRGDIWDRRHKAKALNKNHPFCSKLGQRGEKNCCSSSTGRPAGQQQSSFFFPPLHSFYFINLTSPLPFHTSVGTSPRLSLTSPKSHCVWRPTSPAVPSSFFLARAEFIETDWKSQISGRWEATATPPFTPQSRQENRRAWEWSNSLPQSVPSRHGGLQVPLCPKKTCAINSSQTILLLFSRILDGSW